MRDVDRTQIFTPPDLADFMVHQLNLSAAGEVDLLEPGAGAGALAESVIAASPRPPRLTLVERDLTLGSHLSDLVEHHRSDIAEDSEALTDDFFALAPAWIADGRRFTHIITNPPFARVEPQSHVAAVLRKANVRATNYFAAFLWLASDLLADGGTMVAVVPRSILSGARYAATRAHMLEGAALVALHHFTDRRAVFERDSVQQEVVVLTLSRGAAPSHIRYSQSATVINIPDAIQLPHRRIQLDAADGHAVLVPTIVRGEVDPSDATSSLLPDGVQASVGNVVDFRAGADVVVRGDGEIPLVGSEIFFTRTPDLRALRLNDRTQRHVFPPGRYVVIRRISPSEARPRIQAKLVVAEGDEFSKGVAFENHLLVLHANGKGMTPETCSVLLERLSDARTERQFCERGGTTQVNVGDIRALRYEGSSEE
ncbi:Eco57I restriction-modification methylase domain-containing protein [Herbiconiux sp.]|uniref:Eco57I restriction-modification methylase domain-containing protein n=1 Tax=Herbiconiux sp. TaxID=1871186 RepID=UPI0025BB1DD5|nr:Eco57I restriction-modification methylase domain-containing protein [Herbiconiux sp.]